MKTKTETPSTPKDPERFYCPFPGCTRSFAELWRLKVHYRAPPDIRGSGKERGHGTELAHCPKCGKNLKPGKHHVGCSAGKTAPKQATKRSRASDESGEGDVAATEEDTAAGAAEFVEYQHNFDLSHLTQGQMGGWPEFAAQEPAPALSVQPVVFGSQPNLGPQQHNAGLLPSNALLEAPQHMYPVVVPQIPVNPMVIAPPFYPGPHNFGGAPVIPVETPQHSFHNVFDYDQMDFSRIPSPPPLPADFQPSSSASAGLLFNFKQFSERLPSHSQQSCKLSQESSDIMKYLAEPSVVYDQSEDGDLMQLLIGLPDELPAMATIHVHHWTDECDGSEHSKTHASQQQNCSGLKEAQDGASRLNFVGFGGSSDSKPGGQELEPFSSATLGASSQYAASPLGFDFCIQSGLESAMDGLRMQGPTFVSLNILHDQDHA